MSAVTGLNELTVLDELKLHFFPKEFACKDGSVSPYGKWNVVPALVSLCERIRCECGFPLYVSSGYRSPEYNKKIGGVADSQHCKGTACDLHAITSGCSADEAKRRKEKLMAAAQTINENGGVGYYDWGVHIDVRGYKARWDCRST